MKTEKPKRNGVFVGGYVPPHVKEFVQRRARAQHKTASQILKEILIKEIAADFVGEKQTEPNMEAKCKPIGEAFQIVCDVCLIQFIVPADFREQKIVDSSPFYCPNGHRLIYDRREAKSDGN